MVNNTQSMGLVSFSAEVVTVAMCEYPKIHFTLGGRLLSFVKAIPKGGVACPVISFKSANTRNHAHMIRHLGSIPF